MYNGMYVLRVVPRQVPGSFVLLPPQLQICNLRSEFYTTSQQRAEAHLFHIIVPSSALPPIWLMAGQSLIRLLPCWTCRGTWGNFKGNFDFSLISGHSFFLIDLIGFVLPQKAVNPLLNSRLCRGRLTFRCKYIKDHPDPTNDPPTLNTNINKVAILPTCSVNAPMMPPASPRKKTKPPSIWTAEERKVVNVHKEAYRQLQNREERMQLFKEKVLVDIFNHWDDTGKAAVDEEESQQRVKVSGCNPSGCLTT
jgi:hypothetical protein